MPVHLGFLRAVNVGKRQYKTADLRAALSGAGYAEVDTHIQTGNIRISAPLRSRAKVESELEALFAADRGFEVVTMVRSPAQLREIASVAAELDAAHHPEYGHYVSFLKSPPDAAASARAEALSGDGERLVIRGAEAHLLYDIPYGEARNSNAQVEKILGPATNRNLKVVDAIIAKWC